ncbi:MAG: glycosyltransferase, partial [Candidatus Omnitrophica bacterium]|nr:glycosyltransferase [Candidatus Omnitrophota bacterium]
LVSYKGPDILVKSVPIIMNRNPDIMVVLVGDGRLRRYLENLTKEMSIQNRIIFTGVIGENLKPLYYKAADIFVRWIKRSKRGKGFKVIKTAMGRCFHFSAT